MHDCEWLCGGVDGWALAAELFMVKFAVKFCFFETCAAWLHMHLSLAVLAVKRLKPNGLGWFAPECGSLGFMNSGTSNRSVWDTMGNVNIQSVRTGTMLVNRTTFACACHGVEYVYDPPQYMPCASQCLCNLDYICCVMCIHMFCVNATPIISNACEELVTLPLGGLEVCDVCP